jgi:hypothetical protein
MSFKVVDKYFSGQGNVYLAEIDPATNKPKGFVNIGNAPVCKISFKTDVEDKFESRSGNQLLAKRIPRKKTSDCTISIENCSKENLAIALYGASNVITGAAVAGESAIAYLGAETALLNPGVSAVVVKGTGAKSAKTYVLNKNYTVDTTYGTIHLMTTAEQTAAAAADLIADGDALAIDYTFASYTKTQAFTHTGREYVVRMEGVNTAESADLFLAQIWRFMPEPLKELSLIDDKTSPIELTGAAMADTSRADGDQFFTLIKNL